MKRLPNHLSSLTSTFFTESAGKNCTNKKNNIAFFNSFHIRANFPSFFEDFSHPNTNLAGILFFVHKAYLLAISQDFYQER